MGESGLSVAIFDRGNSEAQASWHTRALKPLQGSCPIWGRHPASPFYPSGEHCFSGLGGLVFPFSIWKGEHHATSQVCLGRRKRETHPADGGRSPAQVVGETFMTGREAKRIAAFLMQQARENHEQIIELIEALEKSGDIEKGELDHYKKLAQKWLEIARENRAKGLKQK